MEEKKSYFKWGEFLSYYKPFRGRVFDTLFAP